MWVACVMEIDGHINDLPFANTALAVFYGWIADGKMDEAAREIALAVRIPSHNVKAGRPLASTDEACDVIKALSEATRERHVAL